MRILARNLIVFGADSIAKADANMPILMLMLMFTPSLLID